MSRRLLLRLRIGATADRRGDRLVAGCLHRRPSGRRQERHAADLARRIQEAKEDLADARDDDSRTKAEQFLHQLTTLEGAILPA
jgi:hypothetical protein